MRFAVLMWMLTVGGCKGPDVSPEFPAADSLPAETPAAIRKPLMARERVVANALGQVGVTRGYDPGYSVIPYPMGDVPLERGVCTDVVIRAFRAGGIDLQEEVHEDMRRAFGAYPNEWGQRGPDRNIDHRRVPNLMTYLKRAGYSLPLDGDYQAGDVVAWRLPGGRLHIGIVVDPSRELVVHNIGAGARSEAVLREWKAIGHYRMLE